MFNILFGISYLRHQFTAKNRHGLHSPFVYRLVDEVIYDYSDKKIYHPIEAARKRLLNDNATIAKTQYLSPRLAQLIYRLAADYQPRNMIVLGTSLGITTLYLQQANPLATIYTLHDNPETAAITREIFKQQKANKIEQLIGGYDDTLPKLIDSLPRLDFVLIGGNTTSHDTLKCFELCLPKVHQSTLLIFDNIHSNQSMQEAWAQIKAHPQVTITVDLFWIGLVYFRQGKIKEDFKIRF